MKQSPDATRRFFAYMKEAAEAMQGDDRERKVQVWNALAGQLDHELREPRHRALAKQMLGQLQTALRTPKRR